MQKQTGFRLSALFFDMLDNVRYFTIQNKTQGVNRLCAYIVAVFHSVDCIGGKSLFKYQLIFCYSLFQKGVIERFITYQCYHHIQCSIPKLLTILNKLSIIENN